MHTRLTQVRDGLRIHRAEGKPLLITGYGAVFYRAGDPGTEYWLWSDMVERIMPGAFDRAILEDDCRCFFNHDATLVLGRNRAGTLRLRVDERGLLYETTPPDTQLVRDQVVAPIERGDVTGSSFMFLPRKTVWVEEQQDGKPLYIRELHDCELWEVGPVVFPAYEATTTGVRAEAAAAASAAGVCLRAIDPAAARAELTAWLQERTPAREEAERVELEYVTFRRREAELRLEDLLGRA